MDDSLTDNLNLPIQYGIDLQSLKTQEKEVINDLLAMITLLSEGISPKNQASFKVLRHKLFQSMGEVGKTYNQFRQIRQALDRQKHKHHLDHGHNYHNMP
jgi:hypothetical protein